MATTEYAAAIDTNDLIMAYGPEAVWGTKPLVAFQDIRLDSEGFSSSKSRTRPNEISAKAQAAAGITTKEESTGSLNFSVSAGTHNDLVASSIGGVFTTPLNIVARATIAAVADGFTDSGAGFVTDGIQVGQMINVSGFSDDTIDAVYRVDSVVAGAITTTPVPVATSVAGDAITIKGSMCRNGKVIQSFFFQKQLAAALFFQYAGSWPTGGSFDVGVGDYLKGTLSFINKAETSAIAEGSTGAHTAAPTGQVIDSISGIGNVYRNGAAVDAIIQKIGIKWDKAGARAQYGIGSSDAQGIGNGLLTVTGTLSSYFKDLTLYNEFKSEVGGPIWFQALDADGKGYVITFCSAKIMNPKVAAGGASQDFMADFEIEGEPGDATLYGGQTMQIDYFG